MDNVNTQFDSELLHLVGECIAKGHATTTIIQQLVQEKQVSQETAVALVKHCYEGWRLLENSLELSQEDFRRWHINQRHRLLVESLKDRSHQGLKVALQILDSLKALHQLDDDKNDEDHPLRVVFEPLTDNQNKQD
jgi:hypothetical protein